MAFHQWSVPLFFGCALAGFGIIVFAAWRLSRRGRVMIIVPSAILISLGCALGSWVNQGGGGQGAVSSGGYEIAQALFLADWAYLAVVVVLASITAVLTGHVARRSPAHPAGTAPDVRGVILTDEPIRTVGRTTPREPSKGQQEKPGPAGHHTLWTIIMVVAFVVAVVALVVGLGQRSLIYYPDPMDPGPVAERAPNGEDVSFTTADGLTLGAWMLRPAAANGIAVLYLPGNGGNRRERLDVGEAIADLGYTVLLMDYRGYGGNPGSPTEPGLLLDARAAAEYLRKAGFPPSKTLYVGESVGTGVAVQLAVTDPPAGVLLRSPYTSLVAVARDLYPWLPAGLILEDRFDTLAQLPKVTMPITVLCGSADTLISPEQSRAVADQAPNLFEFQMVSGADHNDDVWFGPYLAEKVDRLAKVAVPG